VGSNCDENPSNILNKKSFSKFAMLKNAGILKIFVATLVQFLKLHWKFLRLISRVD
jgi:hypothetical protein